MDSLIKLNIKKRPNIHIEDVTDLYVQSLAWPETSIDGKVFNAGYENHKVIEIAEIAQKVIGPNVEVVTTPTDDLRSYQISSEKIRIELGYAPKRSIEEGVEGLVAAFNSGKILDPMNNIGYYNIKTMQSLNLK